MALGRGVRNKCKGRRSPDGRDWTAASGIAPEPSPSPRFLLHWATQNRGAGRGGACAQYCPGPGLLKKAAPPPPAGDVPAVTQFPLLPSGSPPNGLSQVLEHSAHLRLLLPAPGALWPHRSCGLCEGQRARWPGRGGESDSEARCGVSAQAPRAPPSLANVISVILVPAAAVCGGSGGVGACREFRVERKP